MLIMLIMSGRCFSKHARHPQHCGQDIAAVLLTLIVYSRLLQPATSPGGRAGGRAGRRASGRAGGRGCAGGRASSRADGRAKGVLNGRYL